MFRFNFWEQINSRIRIDSIIKSCRRLQRFDVDSTINIQPLTATVGFELFFLTLLDPAVRRNAVVLRVGGVSKINRVVFVFVGLDMFIFVEKCLLLGGVLFTGNMRRLLVGKPKAMQLLCFWQDNRIILLILSKDWWLRWRSNVPHTACQYERWPIWHRAEYVLQDNP